MRVKGIALFIFTCTLAWGVPVHAEPVVLYSQPDDSGEMLSQQATYQNTWISAPLGNLFLGKDSLSITFTMKDPNASTVYHSPFGGVAIGTSLGGSTLQKYYFTDADRALLADGAFHTFTVQTGTTTLGVADGETPVYITFFNLSEYHNGTHLKSNAAGTAPYLSIEAASLPTLPPIPQAPPGSITLYEQGDKSGLMTNSQPTYQNAYINSASLGNIPLGQGKLYLTFTMKDPRAGNVHHTPAGVALAACANCQNLQTYFFTDADRALLADGAFHTFMVETGTTTSTYADGTRPVVLSFFGLSQYQYGTKIKSNAEQTIPFLTIQAAAPPDPCAVPGTCASNVLFLPGIEASRLYATSTDILGITHEDQLWEPNNNGDAEELSLTADGVSIKENIYTREIIDEKNVLPIGQGNIYKSFITQMNGLKDEDKIINDWKAAPYDWRFALDDILSKGAERNDNIYYEDATSTPYIEQTLRALAASSKTGKVTIVAHSNGGLVAKALTEKLGSEAAALIDKMIFVAVPQVGTPQAVGALLHGYDQGLPFDWLPIILSPGTARTLAKNMPMTYNLLPSFSYFTQVNESVVTFDDSDILSEFRARYGSSIHDSTLLKNFITDTRRLAASSPSDLIYPAVGNAALYTLAETAHASLDTWTPPQGVSLYEIAGWGEDTLATIEYKGGKKTVCAGTVSPSGTCSRFTTVPTISYYPKEVVEGDGTVLVPSALWAPASATTAKYWVNLRDYGATGFFGSTVNREHADILEIPQLRTLVQNILTNSTSTLPAFITTAQPTATDGDNRLRFLLHSPLDLSVTDDLGHIVNSATSTIPGARWKRYGEVQVLTVPAGTPVTLGLDGYATGSFTLDLEEIGGSNIVTASSTFSAIPSATSTRATMAFTDGTLQGASPLLLDYDGDGATDFSLKPKIGEEVVLDTTPPEATLTFDPASQKFSVIGSDDISTTTVSTTATSTTITDESGNTLQIIFRNLKQEKKEMKIEIRELRYNGVSSGTIPKTVLQYEWSTDKKGKLKEFEEKVETNSLVVTGHYDVKKNVTKIEEKMRDNKKQRREGDRDKRGDKNEKGDKESEKTLPGLIIIGLITDKGEVSATY